MEAKYEKIKRQFKKVDGFKGSLSQVRVKLVGLQAKVENHKKLVCQAGQLLRQEELALIDMINEAADQPTKDNRKTWKSYMESFAKEQDGLLEADRIK